MKLKPTAVKLTLVFLTTLAAALCGALISAAAMSGSSASYFFRLTALNAAFAAAAALAACPAVLPVAGKPWRLSWKRILFADYFLCSILFFPEGVADNVLYALFNQYAYDMGNAVPWLLYLACPMLTGAICSRFLPQPVRPQQEIML